IAIDRDPARVDLARRVNIADEGRRVFFKVSTAEDTRFGDEVFDAIVGNLLLAEIREPLPALVELRRVLQPGGRIYLTQALFGSFEEVLDMFGELEVRYGLDDMIQRKTQLVERYPTAEALGALVRGAGFSEAQVREEEFRLPFRSAQELFTDPLITLIAMPEWRWLAGTTKRGAEHLQEVEQRLDTYFRGGPLSLTVRAGMVSATRPHA
ncbi:MAG: class I SAM-dependent methyltransferase, partial [Myxococcota bacterium]